MQVAPPEAQPETEPESVAKKKAPKSSSEQREIAVARATALIEAGEERKKALEIVGKEMGYSRSTLNKWLIADKKASRTAAKRTAKKRGTKKKVGRGSMGPRSSSKAAFVRSHLGFSNEEIVKLAKQQGMKLAVGYIYNIRSGAKGSSPAPSPQRPSKTSGGIGELIGTAIAALQEIERRLSQLAL